MPSSLFNYSLKTQLYTFKLDHTHKINVISFVTLPPFTQSTEGSQMTNPNHMCENNPALKL